jgi:hypothetical protein
VRGSHIKLGEGKRKVRLGQDSLPNKAETSGNYIRCFTHTLLSPTNLRQIIWLPLCKMCIFEKGFYYRLKSNDGIDNMPHYQVRD